MSTSQISSRNADRQRETKWCLSCKYSWISLVARRGTYHCPWLRRSSDTYRRTLRPRWNECNNVSVVFTLQSRLYKLSLYTTLHCFFLSFNKPFFFTPFFIHTVLSCVSLFSLFFLNLLFHSYSFASLELRVKCICTHSREQRTHVILL